MTHILFEGVKYKMFPLTFKNVYDYVRKHDRMNHLKIGGTVIDGKWV